jgi:hypothetical protein
MRAIAIASLMLSGCFLTNTGDQYRFGDVDGGPTPMEDAFVEPGRDDDMDMYVTPDDCNDGDPNVHPGATETCNGVDDDCVNGPDDGVIGPVELFYDGDGDNYGELSAGMVCPAPGVVAMGGDCDDMDGAINPEVTDTTCDAIDSNCDQIEDAPAGVCPAGCAPFELSDSLHWVCLEPARNWMSARDFCEGMGMQLVRVDDAVEQAGLASLGVTAWIGATDQSSEGDFSWPDGSLLRDTYESWEAGEPNDTGVGEDCVSQQAKGGWRDEACGLPQALICEEL